MPLQKGFNDEIKALTQEPIQGVAANDTYDVVLTTQGKNVDFPLRMYASATPDGFLNFSGSQTALGDGATRVIPPMNGSGFASVAATTINFGANTGAVSGGLTINLNGTGFAAGFVALTKTDTKFRRFVFALQQDGTVTAAVSAEAASQGALTDYGSIFATIGVGSYIGHIDLVYVGSATKYKTAGAGTNVIADGGIFRPAASGGGGGAQAPLVLQSASTPNVTIAGGVLPLQDGRELMTWDGGGTATTNYGSPLSFSATTVLAASPAAIGGGGSPANATRYHFYIDLDSLGTVQTIASGTYLNRQVFQVTSSNLVIGTTGPDTANRSRYVWLGEVTTTSGGAWSGTGATLIAATRMMWINGPIATSLVVSRPQTGGAVGAVGGTGQIAFGHVLSSKSFPSSIGATQYSIYGLAAGSGTDGNGTNAKNLTANGSPGSATGFSNTAGEASSLNGTSQSFSSSNAYFNPGNGVSWSVGCLAKAPSWTGGTGGVLFSQETAGGTGTVFDLSLGNTGSLAFRMSTNGSTFDAIITVPVNFGANTWHHIAMSYNFTTKLFTAYIDGHAQESISVANTVSSGAPLFVIGGRHNPVDTFFTGTVDEAFFVNGFALSDGDMRRIASYRFDHNASVAGKNQRWAVKVYPNGGEPGYRPANVITGEDDSNSVFWDFSDLGSTDTVDVILEDLGLAPFVIPGVKPYDNIFTSAFPSSVAHGQPDVPVVEIQFEDGTTGEYAPIGIEGKIRVDSTNIYFDGPFPSVPAAAPNRAWVTARSKTVASVGVPDATPARSGVVTTSLQNFAGPKVAQDGISNVANVRASEGSGTTTLTSSDNRHQIFNLSAARTCVLPTTGIVKGEEFVIENQAAFDLTIQSSNGTEITSAGGSNMTATHQKGNCVLVALQAAPTTPAHWRVKYVEDEFTISAGSVGVFSGSGSVTAGTAEVYWRRVCQVVTGRMRFVSISTSGTPGAIGPNTGTPARFQPPRASDIGLTFLSGDSLYKAQQSGGSIGLYRHSSALAATGYPGVSSQNYPDGSNVDMSFTYIVAT